MILLVILITYICVHSSQSQIGNISYLSIDYLSKIKFSSNQFPVLF